MMLACIRYTHNERVGIATHLLGRQGKEILTCMMQSHIDSCKNKSTPTKRTSYTHSMVVIVVHLLVSQNKEILICMAHTQHFCNQPHMRIWC